MTHPQISLNGIDPNGEHPPDELVYHPDDGEGIELTRQSDEPEWSIRWESSPAESRHFNTFAVAFAQFTAHINEAEQ